MAKEKIALVGAGMIGMSMAVLFTGNGYDVKVLVRSEASRENALEKYRNLFAVIEERNLVTKEQITACEKLLHFVQDYADLSDREIFFECVVEELSAKQEVYRNIAKYCPKTMAIASMSSAKSPDDLSAGLSAYAEKIMVAHPFYPPHIVPFVEQIRGEKTDADAAQSVYDVLEDCGRKVCVMKKAAPGFIANRLQHAILREAIYMVEQGMADPADIDKALKYSFMPRYSSVGLFEHQDAAGLDMVKNIDDYLYPYLSDQKQTFDSINEKVTAGKRGMKDGEGIYVWTEETKARFHHDAAEPYWKFFNWNLPEA